MDVVGERRNGRRPEVVSTESTHCMEWEQSSWPTSGVWLTDGGTDAKSKRDNNMLTVAGHEMSWLNQRDTGEEYCNMVMQKSMEQTVVN